MEKVFLPKEVAEAISYIRESGMSEHALYDRKWLTGGVDDTKSIRDSKDAILVYIDSNVDRFNPDNTLIRYYKAIVNGYEVEETPEDKLRALYDRYSGSDDRKYRGMVIGIKEALNALNIKIKGLNAE